MYAHSLHEHLNIQTWIYYEITLPMVVAAIVCGISKNYANFKQQQLIASIASSRCVLEKSKLNKKVPSSA